MEKLRPFATRISIIRLFADMQVCSTYKSVKNLTKKLLIKDKVKGRMLDVGCGNQPYQFLFEEPNMRNIEYIAIDWDGAETGFDYDNKTIIHYDGVHFPFENEEFDLVFHTEVTEHVQDVKFFFQECFRILKTGGELMFSMPFSARYHYIPYDYWRFTPSGLKLLLESTGFSEIFIFPRSTDITVACYKVISIGYRWVLSKKIFKLLFAILLLPLWIGALLVGQMSIWCNLGETDDCLGYTVYARKQF